MNHRRLLVPLFLLLSFALIACTISLPVLPTTPPEEDIVATAVQATLNAGAPPADATLPPAEPTAALVEPTVAPPTYSGPIAEFAYTDTNRNLWAWSQENGLRQLTVTADVDRSLLSPDGSRIVYVRTLDWSAFSVWTVYADGTGNRELISTYSLNLFPHATDAMGNAPIQLAWLPGNPSVVAFNTRSVFQMGLMTNDDLWFLNLDTGELTNQLTSGSGGYFYFSPDGSQIAISKPTSISLLNTDGTNIRYDVATFLQVNTASEYLFCPPITWSPDGASILFAIPPQEPWGTSDPTYVYSINATTLAQTELAQLPGALLNSTTISPAGTHAAWMRTDPANNLEMRLYNLTSGTDTYFATQTTEAIWSPGGQYFLSGNQIAPGGPVVYDVGAYPNALSASGYLVDGIWMEYTRFAILLATDTAYEVRVGSASQVDTILIASLPKSSSGYMPSLSQ
jgi:hypothetical protein